MSEISLGDRAAESIKTRAKARGINPFSHLQRFALERIMYRIAEPCGRQVMLKGSAIDLVTGDPAPRPIDDIDISMELPVDEIEEHIPAILGGRYFTDDGLVDDALVVTRIKSRRIETDSRQGVAFRLECFVGRTRINVSIDATADAEIPPYAQPHKWPGIFPSLPTAWVRCQPVEYRIAEKPEALTSMGLTNTRVKDVFDIWRMLEAGDFEEGRLVEAIADVFERRGTDPDGECVGLSSTFAELHEAHWAAWKLETGIDDSRLLADLCGDVRKGMADIRSVRAAALRAFA